MLTKICSRCKTEKTVEEFRFKNKAAGILQRSCRDCTKLQFKLHYEANKGAIIAKQLTRNKTNSNQYYAFKKTLECCHCGEAAPYCLDFHHVDGADKQFSVANHTQINWGTLVRELEKCVCLCSNCHRKVHAGDLAVQDDWSTGPRSLMNKALAFEASR